MYWNNKPECPVCHEVVGFVEGLHGGLGEREILQLSQEYLKLKRVESELISELTVNKERGF